MTGKLLVFPQMASELSTKSHNCGPCAVAAIKAWFDGERALPKRSVRDELIKLLRDRANPDAPDSGTSLVGLETAYEKLPGHRMRKLLFGDIEQDLWPAVSKSSLALVGVNYGVVNEKRPNLSGSRGFDGGHWIVVAKGREVTKDGQKVRLVTVLDSTRSRPTIWPWTLLRAAAAEFADPPAGDGRVAAGIVRPPKPPAPQPGPGPAPAPNPDAEALAAITAERDALKSRIDAALAVLQADDDDDDDALDGEDISDGATAMATGIDPDD